MISLITDETTGAATPQPLGKFALGRIVATPGVIAAVPNEELLNALSRHHHGDWGDLCDADRQKNERSLRDGFRLMSVYHSKSGAKFYIITEQDRSVTTLLLPEEY